jgi:hypothetical protein
MPPFLIPVAELESNRNSISQLIETSRSGYAIDLENELYGSSFVYFLLFSLPLSALHTLFPGLSEEGVLYNRYYWFLNLSKLYMRVHGYDVAWEQQAFQMLEHASCPFDWSKVEEVFNFAEPDF